MAKNNCLTNEKLQEYLDNNLTGKESEQIGEHISNCPACRQHLDTLKTVYSQATSFAKMQLSEKADKTRLNRLMSDIKKETIQNKKAEPKKSLQLLEFLTQNTGWFIVPAMALVLLWVFFPATEIDRQKKDAIKFNLANNRVNIVFADDQAKASIETDQIKLAELKTIPVNKMISLPSQSIIIIKSGNHGFQLSEQAVFTFKNNSIALEHGKIECKLQGEHKNFLVTTKFAEIQPLGTSFSLTATDWYCKINLKSGKLKITSFAGQHRTIEQKQIIYVDKKGSFLKELKKSNFNQDNNTDQSLSGSSSNKAEPTTKTSSSPRRLIDSF
ncbi:MAG: anti-sigma factor family protein [Candidatus Rifleibacteriota bacterium]